MDNLIAILRQQVWVTLKHRWLVLLVAALASAAAAAGLTFYKDRYKASAQIFVDTQTVLKPMMASLTYLPDMEQQVAILARTLVSRPNVERLLEQPEIQLAFASSADRDATVTRLMKQIKIAPTASGNLYDISYSGENPEGARRLVTATINMFVSSAAGNKRRDARDAGQFIEEQIRAHESKLIEAEEHLKAFRIRNFGVSGVANQDYFARVSDAAEQMEKHRAELLAAERSRDAYQRELANEDPLLPIESSTQAPGVPAETDAERRLSAHLRAHDELLSRYTEVHPDVISSRRTLLRLEQEALVAREERTKLLAASAPTHTGGRAATSPIYQRLRISLAEAEAEVASLTSQLGTKEVQLMQVRALANRAPMVEAEHAQLNRDYDVIRKNYESLVARRESAALGARLDEASHLTEFRVVEPPRVSSMPVFPSRLDLAALAVAVSLVLGILAAHVADSMSPTIDDPAQLSRLSDRPLLGSVATVFSPVMSRVERRRNLAFASAFGLMFSVQIAWVTLLAMAPTQW